MTSFTATMPTQTANLPDADLLATLLGGDLGATTAQELMATYGDLPSLARADPSDLTAVRGLRRSKAQALLAALELSRRIQQPRVRSRIRISQDVFDICQSMRLLTNEEFHTLCLDAKHNLLRDARVVAGGITTCSVLPREAFAPAIRTAAAAVVFVHNHPSGDPTPSDDDFVLTKRLKQAGGVLGINVLDHIVIGDCRYSSMADSGRFSGL